MVKCLFYSSITNSLSSKNAIYCFILVTYCPIYYKGDVLIYLPRLLSLMYLMNSPLLHLEYPSANGVTFSFLLPTISNFQKPAIFWGLYAPILLYFIKINVFNFASKSRFKMRSRLNYKKHKTSLF